MWLATDRLRNPNWQKKRWKQKIWKLGKLIKTHRQLLKNVWNPFLPLPTQKLKIRHLQISLFNNRRLFRWQNWKLLFFSFDQSVRSRISSVQAGSEGTENKLRRSVPSAWCESKFMVQIKRLQPVVVPSTSKIIKKITDLGRTDQVYLIYTELRRDSNRLKRRSDRDRAGLTGKMWCAFAVAECGKTSKNEESCQMMVKWWPNTVEHKDIEQTRFASDDQMKAEKMQNVPKSVPTCQVVSLPCRISAAKIWMLNKMVNLKSKKY